MHPKSSPKMSCRNRDLFSKSPIVCPLLVVAGYKLKAW